MATPRVPSAKFQNLSTSVTTALASVLLEWLLIFFLFTDAIFSYVITKFAGYCKLQKPCLFCSRLDHVLGKEKRGYYWDLICTSHKLEISSLVLCPAHDKLVNVHGHRMCENCHISFASTNKSNVESETYPLLVGKLGGEPQSRFDQDPLPGEHKDFFSTAKYCSCWDEHLVLKGCDQRLLFTNSTESEAADFDRSDAVGNDYHKKRRAKPLVSARAVRLRNKLKITSDTESEIPLSDDDGSRISVRGADDTKEDIKVHSSKYAAATIESIKSKQTSPVDCEKIIKSGSCNKLTTSEEAGVEPNPVSSDTGQKNPNLLDLGDAYKLAISNRRKQLSGMLAEHWLEKGSTRVSEDLKILLSQLSATRGTDLSVDDMSPQLSVNGDEVKTSDVSTTAGMQMLRKRILLESIESGLCLDESIVSEIEDESVVDSLQRQVDRDRKVMSAMYKELEEERNASAVAANQALAMITRLQEEKATRHMEALQYLRMMEEQSQYDVEALQKANDLLLVEKEKEIQDLETKLEFYGKKFPDESVVENMV